MKKYNKALFLSLLFTLFFIISFNYYINPLGVFSSQNKLNKFKQSTTKNQRISLIPALKLNKNKIDAVWVGNSRTGWFENELYDSKTSGKNIVNLCVNASSFEESINMAYNAILIHPEIKEIYLGLDFPSFKKSYENKDYIIERETKKNIKKEEVLPLLLSGNVFIYSFNTVIENIKYKDINVSEEELAAFYGKEKQYNENIPQLFKENIQASYKEEYKNYEFDRKNFDELKELINYADKKGIKIIFFIAGMHITERILINQTENLENLYMFKKELANIQPYYDFSLVNKYTVDEIRPDMQYFRDMVHPYPYLRRKISNQLFLNNEDFGVLVNKNNVDKIIKEDNIKYEKYVKENKNVVNMVKEQIK